MSTPSNADPDACAPVMLRALVIDPPGSIDRGALLECQVDYYSREAFAAGIPEVVRGAAIDTRARAIAPGDVLVSALVDAPRRAWVVGAARTRPQIASGDWLILRGAQFEPRYLRHLLVSNDFHLRFERALAARASRPRRVRASHIATIALAKPALERQARIAGLLDQVDALRAKRGATLSLLAQLPAAVFAELCGETVPAAASWPRVRLASLCAVAPARGAAHSIDDRGEWSVVGRDHVVVDRVELLASKHARLDRADADRYGIEDGDALLVAAGAWPDDLGRCAVAQPGPSLWTYDARSIRLRLDRARVEPRYLSAWLASRAGRGVLGGIARRARAQFTIAPDRLAGLAIPLPPLSLQHELVRGLAQCDALRASLLRSSHGVDALLSTLRDRAYRDALELA